MRSTADDAMAPILRTDTYVRKSVHDETAIRI
jgi:hypothetical protein